MTVAFNLPIDGGPIYRQLSSLRSFSKSAGKSVKEHVHLAISPSTGNVVMLAANGGPRDSMSSIGADACCIVEGKYAYTKFTPRTTAPIRIRFVVEDICSMLDVAVQNVSSSSGSIAIEIDADFGMTRIRFQDRGLGAHAITVRTIDCGSPEVAEYLDSLIDSVDTSSRSFWTGLAMPHAMPSMLVLRTSVLKSLAKRKTVPSSALPGDAQDTSLSNTVELSYDPSAGLVLRSAGLRCHVPNNLLEVPYGEVAQPSITTVLAREWHSVVNAIDDRTPRVSLGLGAGILFRVVDFQRDKEVSESKYYIHPAADCVAQHTDRGPENTNSSLGG